MIPAHGANLRRWAVPARVAAADRRLVGAFDAAIAEGEKRAASHLACRLGCTACCVGPFDITALDAARLAVGLARLQAADEGSASAVRRRAAEQWRRMARSFPGDARTGIMTSNET